MSILIGVAGQIGILRLYPSTVVRRHRIGIGRILARRYAKAAGTDEQGDRDEDRDRFFHFRQLLLLDTGMSHRAHNLRLHTDKNDQVRQEHDQSGSRRHTLSGNRAVGA